MWVFSILALCTGSEIKTILHALGRAPEKYDNPKHK